VKALAGNDPPALDTPPVIAPLAPVDPFAESGQRLSAEVIGIIEGAVREAAAARTLAAALEIGYAAFGRSACTAAAREGIAAFQERRSPDFSKTA
jgi:enoyl-CoA hydratase/3-hydroxyacyl-CoA dehydrogenase